MYIHEPVMADEIVEIFQGDHHEYHTFVDGTTGEGGHTEYIAERLHPHEIICFERDAAIFECAQRRLARFSSITFHFFNENFTMIKERCAENERIDGILLDLGISLYHYQQSGRGFSFQADEPLDMRLDGTGRSAADLIKTLKKNELAVIMRDFGEERWAWRIAERIVDVRRKGKAPRTAREFADLVGRAIPRKYWPAHIHPATRVFQAFRIAVNDEFDNLKIGLSYAMDVLAPGGRLCVLTYHSLEDRIVKHVFRQAAQERPEAITLLTKKPIVPKIKEVTAHRTARSAKLRAIERSN